MKTEPRPFLGYWKYRVVDQDPVCDELRTVFKQEGLLNKKGYGIAHQLSGVSASTYEAMFDGISRGGEVRVTKLPRNTTIEATLRALGWRRELKKEKDDSWEIEKELKKAADWFMKQNTGHKPKKRKAKRLHAANGHATKRR